MAAVKPATLLRRLEKVRDRYDPESAELKADLLDRLARRRLTRSAEVERLHEAVCFLRAYPDDARVHESAARLLGGFAGRGDLRRFRDELADSGIAGTPIYFSFYFVTAGWLARRWPGRLEIDWEAFENTEELVDILHLLVPYAETPAVDNVDLDARGWVERLKGPGETDGAFVVRRFEAMEMSVHGREAMFEGVDIPFALQPGAPDEDTPSRTLAHYRPSPVVFQRRPLERKRPQLGRELARPPLSVRTVTPAEGGRLIDLTREAMITRTRDLYSFLHADPQDVRLVDCGDGLQFVCIGMQPGRRLVLEAVYGFLTLKNGVPIGYVLTSSLFGSTEIAYNVFETFRGGEAGPVFGRVMGMARHLFDADTFSIDPYQLGFGNPEGLRSGAWWFYYKLGFRPDDPYVREVLRGELARMKRNRAHRSSETTLSELASQHLFYDMGRPRPDVLGRIPLGRIGMAVSRYVARRFGSNRERAMETLPREAAQRVGLRSMRRFSESQRLLWGRWSPLIMTLAGVEHWSRAERRALVDVVLAKGGRHESDYVTRANAHAPLRRAMLLLTREPL